MRPGKVVALIIGALFGLLSIGLVAGGGVLTWAHATQRDDAGFYNSSTHRFSTPTYAITSEPMDFGDGGPGEWNPVDHVGTVRIQASRADRGEVFVGVARRSDVEAYLRASAHDELADVRYGPFRTTYRNWPGEQVPPAPATQDFWAASASGTGRQSASWHLREGEWSVVVMNADGARGVAVDARAGLATGWLLAIGIGLLAAALATAIIAVVLLFVGLRPDRQGPAWPPHPEPETVPAGTLPAGRYPLRLEGHLDPQLNRWLWLVKWFLVIPHLIVLGVLWAVAAFLTFVAGVSILFTGEYPRAIFDFNVGIMRWTWRVTFYAFALGTDRYPPFSLADDPAFPAHLDVAYPTTLSRPLVLVKWWLLALPHYLIISIFGGGLAAWTWDWGGDNSGRFAAGGGLIALLVFIAAVALLFTGRYPQSLFDLVMGMERWTYRVFAYAGLMTDEYPPFRLDSGGGEAVAVPDYPPPTPDRDPHTSSA